MHYGVFLQLVQFLPNEVPANIRSRLVFRLQVCSGHGFEAGCGHLFQVMSCRFQQQHMQQAPVVHSS